MLKLALSLIAHPEVLAVGIAIGYLVPGSIPVSSLVSQVIAFVKSKI